uniref:Mediator complex subunit Med12 catenin-binding domain-containing protein n=1 Tax=Mola mola TaxID=94237 RepID=A0A3Q3VUK2_MOLML
MCFPFLLQDFVNRTQGGVSYGTNMPPELMQNHPYGRLPYGPQTMNMYTQPLPPGGPGLEPPYRPARNPQMNKMMPTRPNYPGMMPGMQGSMSGMIGLDKQYSMGYKPQPSMPQGQMLRQQLQNQSMIGQQIRQITPNQPYTSMQGYTTYGSHMGMQQHPSQAAGIVPSSYGNQNFQGTHPGNNPAVVDPLRQIQQRPSGYVLQQPPGYTHNMQNTQRFSHQPIQQNPIMHGLGHMGGQGVHPGLRPNQMLAEQQQQQQAAQQQQQAQQVQPQRVPQPQQQVPQPQQQVPQPQQQVPQPQQQVPQPQQQVPQPQQQVPQPQQQVPQPQQQVPQPQQQQQQVSAVPPPGQAQNQGLGMQPLPPQQPMVSPLHWSSRGEDYSIYVSAGNRF